MTPLMTAIVEKRKKSGSLFQQINADSRQSMES
jgi:hypothetical protein